MFIESMTARIRTTEDKTIVQRQLEVWEDDDDEPSTKKRNASALYSDSSESSKENIDNMEPEVNEYVKKSATTRNYDFSSSDDSSVSTTQDFDDCYMSNDEYEQQESKMHRIEYERRCAARRVHSNRKMYFSKRMTNKIRSHPILSPLIARKLRF